MLILLYHQRIQVKTSTTQCWCWIFITIWIHKRWPSHDKWFMFQEASVILLQHNLKSRIACLHLSWRIERNMKLVLPWELLKRKITICSEKESSIDIQICGDQNICLICKWGGNLLWCDGKKVQTKLSGFLFKRSYRCVLFGFWYCFTRVMKMIE